MYSVEYYSPNGNSGIRHFNTQDERDLFLFSLSDDTQFYLFKKEQ